MADRNLAGRSYDVMTQSDGRWLIASNHAVRSAALDAAEALLGGGGDFEAVKVVAESARTGEEEIIFEQETGGGGKKLAIVPTEEAPVCRTLADVYAFPARLAVSRLLRQFLDETGTTALELMVSSGDLRMLERNDDLFGPGMQRLAAVQVKGTDVKPADRIDEIYALFAQAKDVAAALGDDDSLNQILAKADMAALVAAAGNEYTDEARRDAAILAAVADRMSTAGDWNGKLAVLLRLCDGAAGPVIARYLDGAMAEIIDGGQAVVELLGGMADTATAFRNLALLVKGRSELSGDRSAIEALNQAMGRYALAQTRDVLLQRIARGLRGTRPLTKEGAAAEAKALTAIIHELVEDAGLSGGPDMAEALAMRARITLKSGDDDLSFTEGFVEVMKGLPNRAVRLGFLLDLLAAPVASTYVDAIIGQLKSLVAGLKGASSLVQEGAGGDAVHRAVDGLRPRLSAEALPAEFREIFTKAFASMLGEGDAAPPAETPEAPQVPSVTPPKETPEARVERAAEAATSLARRTEKAGTILFEEGDAGDQAYLVASGAVEIFLRIGEREMPIATLERGEIFGEMALIDNSPRAASARAVGDTVLTSISRENFQHRLDKLAESDKVFRRLIDIFAARLRGEVSRRH